MMLGECLLWVLNTIPIVTLIRWNSVRWLPNKKRQALCCFPKTPKLEQAVVIMKRKMSQCVFLALLRLKISSFHSGKILLFPSGSNYQVHKKIFRFSFRAVYTPRHNVAFQKKRGQGECSVGVDCQTYCFSYYVKLYCQMTSQQEVWSILFISEKSKSRPKLFL